MTKMTLPPGAVPPHLTDAYMAVLAVHSVERRVTVRDVADMTGTSIAATHRRLNRLKDLGLVDWEPRRYGTLRPLHRITDLTR